MVSAAKGEPGLPCAAAGCACGGRGRYAKFATRCPTCFRSIGVGECISQTGYGGFGHSRCPVQQAGVLVATEPVEDPVAGEYAPLPLATRPEERKRATAEQARAWRHGRFIGKS